MSRLLALAALLALQAGALAAPPGGNPYSQRADVKAFARELAEQHGFVEKELLFLFSRVRPVQPVLKAIATPPDQARSWKQYRALFLSEKRIAGGAAFWAANRAALARAEQQFGVPARYIVAVIGVETLYGRHKGTYRVVDALATLAFDYPPRAEFFREQLVDFLIMARDEDLDVFSLRGSYAGAFGIPQFMPGSARRFAVDFDSSGRIDLSRSAADAVGSVANFLERHGWQRGGPVALPAQVQGEAWRRYATGEVTPVATLAELAAAGARPREGDAPADARAALIELATPGEPSQFLLGLQNFYAITRYNRSAFYAATVDELAQAIAARMTGR